MDPSDGYLLVLYCRDGQRFEYHLTEAEGERVWGHLGSNNEHFHHLEFEDVRGCRVIVNRPHIQTAEFYFREAEQLPQ